MLGILLIVARVIGVIALVVIVIALYSCVAISGKSNKNDENEEIVMKTYEQMSVCFEVNKNKDVTLEECLNTYLEDSSCAIINDGNVIGFTI